MAYAKSALNNVTKKVIKYEPNRLADWSKAVNEACATNTLHQGKASAPRLCKYSASITAAGKASTLNISGAFFVTARHKKTQRVNISPCIAGMAVIASSTINRLWKFVNPA